MPRTDHPSSPTLQLPGLDKPVICTSCLEVVGDLADVDLEAKLLAHRCPNTASRWAA
jgi:hypothetical protein